MANDCAVHPLHFLLGRRLRVVRVVVGRTHLEETQTHLYSHLPMMIHIFLILLASPTALSSEMWVAESVNVEIHTENSPMNISGSSKETPILMNETEAILPEEALYYSEVEALEEESLATSFEITNPDEVPEGELYEKDILLTPRQVQALHQRKAFNNERFRWSEGSDGYPFVPYRFTDDNVNRVAVENGIEHWETHTCIKFGETSSETGPHLKFFKGGGCYSYIGMVYYWNGQDISIGSGCDSLGTVAHEIGHAMGFYHEQSRSDRDNYVVVNTENIDSSKLNNFDLQSDNNYNIEYDYSSDMHYSMTAFSTNGLPVLVTKDPMAQGLIGQRVGLSFRDKHLANKMYNCIDKWVANCGKTQDPCLNDGYLGSDCGCVCPPGTNGSLCENKYADYYVEIYSDATERITTEKTIMTPNHPNKYPSDTRMTKYIVAPACKTPKVTFSAFQTSSSRVINKVRQCPFAFLNIRKDGDANVGQMYCEQDISPGDIFKSSTREMILYFYARNGLYTGWQATVEFEDSTDPNCDTSVTTTTTTSSTTTTSTSTTTTTTPSTTTTSTSTTTSSTTTTSTTTTTSSTTTTSTSTTTTTSTSTTTTTPSPPSGQCSLTQVMNTMTWKSPYFGNGTYPSNFLCSASITTSHPLPVTVTLKTFVLERPRRRKCVDYVTLSLPYGRRLLLCGTKTGRSYSLPIGALETTFLSNKKKNYKGFEIEMVAGANMDYHRHIILSNTTTSGIITSPGYPKKVANHQAEYWFEAPAGKKVKVEIKEKIKNSKNCKISYLVTNKFGDGTYPADSSDIYCGRKRTPAAAYSDDNKFYMVFDLPKGGSYRIKYYLVDA